MKGHPASSSFTNNDLPNPPPEYRGRGLRVALFMLLLVIAGAAPFLALQAVFDVGVTGKWFDTPYSAYLRQDQPNTSFGFHPVDPAAHPQSVLPQKQWLFDHFYAKYILRHQPSQVLPWWGRVYAPLAADTALPSRVLLIFIPVGLLTLRDRRAAAIAAILPLFVLLYMMNTFFLEHYAILIAPTALLLVLLGMKRTAGIAPPKIAPVVRTALAAGFLAICFFSLPEFNPLWGQGYERNDETFPDAPLMQFVRNELPNASDLQNHRAIILVRWRLGGGKWQNVQEEPVYNTQTAWPDDAPVIFVHDLGAARNQELFRYYAQRQPDRLVFRLDRAADTPEGLIQELGPVSKLVQ
jgi:hypothetical protein